MPRFDLVVFDLDGTLVDTLPAIATACNAVLEEEGLPTHPERAYRRFAGDGAAMLIRRATEHRFDDNPDKVRDLVQRFRERDEKADRDLAKPYEGIDDMLRALAERGQPLAILSNKEHDEAVTLVARCFGLDAFKAVHGHEGTFALKPDPELLLHLIKSQHTTPVRTLYVGDTDTDMRTGRAAGCTNVGCAWGFRDAEELRATGADHIIERPTQLLDLLD